MKTTTGRERIATTGRTARGRFAALLLAALAVLLSGSALAAGGGVHLDAAPIDGNDKESLRNGARLFVDYCLGCHSAKFMRYSRMAEDLEIDEETLDGLMRVVDKPGKTMVNTMPAEQAADWFGIKIPDLSLVSRSRGTDWLYTYLRTFYADPARPFGVNNRVFPDVAMPHVLVGLQGLKQPVYTTDAHGQKVIDHLEPGPGGELTEAQYDRQVADLVNFLDYVGEPVKQKRMRLGLWVLLFLAVFFGLSYALKKEYWRDVH